MSEEPIYVYHKEPYDPQRTAPAEAPPAPRWIPSVLFCPHCGKQDLLEDTGLTSCERYEACYNHECQSCSHRCIIDGSWSYE
jgi:hypothetical protein